MKKIKLYALFLISILFPYNKCFAGTESKVTADPVFNDGGNSWRTISIAPSSMSFVCISTTPSSSNLGIEVWRSREIINIADGDLMLVPSKDSFTMWYSSHGIHLSSDTANLWYGDSYIVPHQGAIWGIWQPGTSTTTLSRGATCTETYWKK